METGFRSIRYECIPTTEENAPPGTTASAPPRSALGPTVSPERGTGLLSRLKARMPGKPSNFDLGLKTVVQQNATHAATLRMRTPEAMSSQPEGRSARFKKKIADAVHHIAGPQPAMALVEPGDIASPDQVQRPEKDKLGRMRATVADWRHPVRSELREAPSDKLNKYLTGKHRREALKEIGKRERYRSVSAEVETKTDLSIKTDLSDPGVAKKDLFGQGFNEVFLWAGHPYVKGCIRDAKQCANERVAEIAKRAPSEIVRVLQMLREVRLESLRTPDEPTLSAADLHKVQTALGELLTSLNTSRLALARECVDDEASVHLNGNHVEFLQPPGQDGPGQREALDLISALNYLARSVSAVPMAPLASPLEQAPLEQAPLEQAPTDEGAVQKPKEGQRRVRFATASSHIAAESAASGAPGSKKVSAPKSALRPSPRSYPRFDETLFEHGTPSIPAPVRLPPPSRALIDSGLLEPSASPANAHPTWLENEIAALIREVNEWNVGTQASRDQTQGGRGARAAVSTPARSRVDSGPLGRSAPPIAAAAAKPAIARPSWLENDEIADLIREVNGWNDGTEASRAGTNGARDARADHASTPSRSLVDSGLPPPSASPTSASETANSRPSWLENEQMAELIRQANGWNQEDKAPREQHDGRLSGDES